MEKQRKQIGPPRNFFRQALDPLSDANERSIINNQLENLNNQLGRINDYNSVIIFFTL